MYNSNELDISKASCFVSQVPYNILVVLHHKRAGTVVFIAYSRCACTVDMLPITIKPTRALPVIHKKTQFNIICRDVLLSETFVNLLIVQYFVNCLNSS